MSPTVHLITAALARCDAVIAGIDELSPFLTPVLPTTAADFGRLAVVERIASVALLKRYEQLQDLVGQLGRLVLAWEAEDNGRLTRRDFANWLERFGAVEDADDFIAFQDLRNRLVHEYPLDVDDQAERVNATWAALPDLVMVTRALGTYLANRGFSR